MLDEHVVAGLSRFMFVPNRVLKADATLVLGMSLWQRPLAVARQIHEAGLAGCVVLTGGFNPKLRACEADLMLQGWQAWGLSQECVLLENRASNTYENMAFSKALLAASGHLRSDMTVNVISINYHMRRALVTLRDVFGPDVELGVINYVSRYCDPKTWYRDPNGRALILEEARKIKQYFPNMMMPCHLLV